jgi:hypothetical protein
MAISKGKANRKNPVGLEDISFKRVINISAGLIKNDLIKK